MKKVKFFLIGLMVAQFAFYSCDKKDDEPQGINPPSPAAWEALKESALEDFIQRSTIDINLNSIQFESEKGVILSIATGCLQFEDGSPIDQNGQLELEYIEIFDRSTMLLANKPTMGHNGDGNKKLLETGGAFYVSVTQGGKKVVSGCTAFIYLSVPAALTTDVADPPMTLWNGVIDDNGDLTWEENNRTDLDIQGGVGLEGDMYYATFENFGWTNIDRFFDFEGETTVIRVAPPTGFDYKNSAIYVSIDGEGENLLAQLDTFKDGYFSEHYGYLPVGLNIHLIFVSENNGQWLYAIKGIKIEKDKTYSFTNEDLKTGTKAQLTAAIKAIQ